MTIAVRYHSRSGNTKKVAKAIAQAVGVKAQTLDTPLDTPVDLLFLGSAVYGFDIDSKLRDFISSLDCKQVKKIVNFSTAAVVKSTYSQVEKLVDGKGITLDAREFHCRGKFKFLHGDRPNAADLEEAKKFALDIVKTM